MAGRIHLGGGTLWSQAQAVRLCRDIERIAPAYGCHVALTGGTLYKDGLRKDVDILFYRIRQVREIDVEGLKGALQVRLGLNVGDDFGWCVKATFDGRAVDLFFPERPGAEGAAAPGYGDLALEAEPA